MSIESQAMFWFRNVCDLPFENLKNEISDDSLLDGLREFGCLLKKVYSDYKSYEISTAERVITKIGIMADDLENYHNFTNLGLCLYYIATVGVEYSEGAIKYLRLDKALFKKSLKNPVTFFFNMLEKYDFYFRYYKKNKEVKEYKLCDTFEVYYENNNSLMYAMKYLNDRLPLVDVKADYANQTTIFLMAGFESIILKETTKRNHVEPLRAGIFNTVGSKREIWMEIVRRMKNEFELDTDISTNTYVFPHWIVKFTKKKRTVCTFQLYNDLIKIRLPLSYDAAKDVIARKNQLPQSIRDCIQNFNCISCGKCSNQSNIEMYEAIHLCRLSYSNFCTEDSRCISIVVQSQEETAAINDIIKSLVM